ncbi:hypothetical protein M3612_19980 [Niallia taxi]|uniref:hypothetical protein n=1 Tax=Niallia taxi TaxID=2499688 RepID=UPI002041B437|nr:hypothetical protein [Niallia taxi]MCM3216768.1 hypothetical protein [Niallia taxi]
MKFLNRPSVKITLGLMTALCTIAFIFVYDMFLRDRIDSVEVVVVKANEEIQKSEKITADKITTERRPKETLISNVVLAKDINSIIGIDSSQLIDGNSMISGNMLDVEEIVPNKEEGEAIRPITKDMIYAQPGSLRRKDTVDIYLVSKDGSNSMQEDGSSSKNSKGSEKASTSAMPFLEDVKVVYVKDSGNKEVVSATTEETPEDQRLNATSTISDLEVILNDEDFTMLMDQVLGNEAKLYITY